jgi:hypothetical protein
MFLSAVSVGCNGSDTVDRTQLFGIWQTEEDGSSTIVTFHSDGTWVSFTKPVSGAGSKSNASGTWKLENGRIHFEVTSAQGGSLEAGDSWNSEILEVTKTKFRLRRDDGGIKEYLRKN